MGLVSLTTISNGQDVDAAPVMSNFNAILAALNGGIDDANFAASSPVVVATSVAGLGAVRAGKAGLLRLSTNPYEYLAVIYDATAGKWVSEPRWAASDQYPPAVFATTNTAYTDLVGTRHHIKNWKAIHDAGMRLQVCYAARLSSSSGAVQARIGVNCYHVDTGDVNPTSLTTGYDAQNTLATSAVYIIRPDWAQPAVTPTKTHGQIALATATQTGGNTAYCDTPSLGIRFVSA